MCVEVGVDVHVCVCPHTRACRCVMVCTQAGASAPPGTGDHTQNAPTSGSRLTELRLTNGPAAQAAPPPKDPAEGEIIIPDDGLRACALCSLPSSR